MGEDNKKTGVNNLSRSMKCSTCDEDSIPFNLQYHAVCILKEESKYLKIKTPELERNPTCAGFNNSHCILCLGKNNIENLERKCEKFVNLKESCKGKGLVAIYFTKDDVHKNYCKNSNLGDGIYSSNFEGVDVLLSC